MGLPDAGLGKYKLSSAEWDALKKLKQILDILHAFQQLLSLEKVPTLTYTIPFFGQLISSLKKEQAKPELQVTYEIIQKGIDKLEDYESRLDSIPANILATCMCFCLHPMDNW